MSTRDIANAARQLLAQYGQDAAVVAVMRAAEFAALGDLEASDHWQEVAQALEQDIHGPSAN